MELWTLQKCGKNAKKTKKRENASETWQTNNWKTSGQQKMTAYTRLVAPVYHLASMYLVFRALCRHSYLVYTSDLLRANDVSQCTRLRTLRLKVSFVSSKKP